MKRKKGKIESGSERRGRVRVIIEGSEKNRERAGEERLCTAAEEVMHSMQLSSSSRVEQQGPGACERVKSGGGRDGGVVEANEGTACRLSRDHDWRGAGRDAAQMTPMASGADWGIAAA